MPNSTAAKKANRQNIIQRATNKSKISRIKTERKKFEKASKAQSNDASSLFSNTQSLLAKAAKKSIVHWKKAARLISRMAKKLKISNN
jgi:small subunit ribosomal protein S20